MTRFIRISPETAADLLARWVGESVLVSVDTLDDEFGEPYASLHLHGRLHVHGPALNREPSPPPGKRWALRFMVGTALFICEEGAYQYSQVVRYDETVGTEQSLVDLEDGAGDAEDLTSDTTLMIVIKGFSVTVAVRLDTGSTAYEMIEEQH